jgi:hypothetical protein
MAFKISGGLEVDNKTGTVRQNQISREYKSKITRTFLDALYAFLDGLVHLASEEGAPQSLSTPVKTTFGTGAGTRSLLRPGSGIVSGVGLGDGNEAEVEAIDVRDTVIALPSADTLSEY